MTPRVQWLLFASIYVLLIVAGIVGLLHRYDLVETRFILRVRDRYEGTAQEVVLTKDADRGPQLEISEPLYVQKSDLRLIDSYLDSDLEVAGEIFFHATPSGRLAQQVDEYLLSFEVSLPDGETTPMRAKVFVPVIRQDTAPVYLFAAGTTGLSERCAPTRERSEGANWGDYHSHLLTQAADGYVVILPDYVGMNDLTRTQPYFIQEYEARAVIGSLLALSKVPLDDFTTQPNFSQIFLGGYSQGGHAVMSAASKPQLWDPAHKLLGIVAYAGASNVEALLTDSPRLAPYLVASYQAYLETGLESDRLLKHRDSHSLLPLAEEKCVDYVLAKFPNTLEGVYTEEAVAALKNKTLTALAPRFANAIQANSLFADLPKDTPILLLQGASDPIVTARTQQENARQFCTQGLPVQYREYAGVNHYLIRRYGYRETTAWMQQRLAGQPPLITCSW